MGTAMPRPPEAEPQRPAITVVPMTRLRSLGPGMLIMASTMVSKTGLAEATPPKPLTAQVLVMDSRAMAAPSAKCLGRALSSMCL